MHSSFHESSRLLITLACASLLSSGCACACKNRSAQSLPHFFKVDSNLFRGGQPSNEGLKWLAESGVKTVISLRAEDESLQMREEKLAESLGMEWVHLPMTMYWKPSDDQIDAFLDVMNDENRLPAFIHCRKGEDRTGTMVAIYRITRQGWEPEEAYSEARDLGLTALNPFVRRLILRQASRKFLPVVASLN